MDGSDTAIGNDASHFNLAINSGSNNSVPPGIPDALHAASDHLPVMLKLAYPTEIEIGIEVDKALPERFVLNQNYPNPFNPVTTVNYSLSISGFVNLSIYNIRGELVSIIVNEFQRPGKYRTNWNADNIASGIYFYRL